MGCVASRTAAASDATDVSKQSRLDCSFVTENTLNLSNHDRVVHINTDTGTSTSSVPVSSANTALRPDQYVTLMHKVKEALQDLTGIANDGSRKALAQAASVLLKHLAVADTVSLIVCTPKCPVSIVGGAVGVGSQEVVRLPARRDSTYSAAVCCRGALSTPYLYGTVDSTHTVNALPPDWAILHRDYGLSSFLAVAVAHSNDVVGVLTLASKQVSVFQESWLEPLLGMLCSGLAPFLGHPLPQGLCDLADSLYERDFTDYRVLIKQLIKASTHFLDTATNLKFGVRLALLGTTGEEPMLILHQVDEERRTSACAGGASTGGSTSSLAVLNVPAVDTIMWEAHKGKGPRMVCDARVYVQTVERPAADVFLDGQPPISSLLVIPFLYDDESVPLICRCGLYLASPEAGDFSESRRAIVSCVALLQWLLVPHLKEGGMLAAAMDSISGLKGTSCTEVLPEADLLGLALSDLPVSSAATLHLASSDGLMQVLQEQLRSCADRRQRARSAAGVAEDLTLKRPLGIGGFGTVYKGIWRGSTAAVKVMKVPMQQRRMMKVAQEMAVQQSLSHPNIVRVYAVFTDMVQETVNAEGIMTSMVNPIDPAVIRFRHAGPHNSSDANMTCNIMVMELCDMGCLDSAIQRGVLHACNPVAGVTVVNMMWLLIVLLDIARSLQHIHAQSIVHCDLKPANVLLKSNKSSPLGFDCKLGDFGLVKWMSSGQSYLHNNSICGTLTHLAPERFKTGSRLTSAVDIYAFGLMMHEAYTRKRPFAGYQPGATALAVLQGQRPVFGSGVPLPYSQLAEACWAQNAGDRPTASGVIEKLQDMLNQCELLRAQQKGPGTAAPEPLQTLVNPLSGDMANQLPTGFTKSSQLV